MFCLDYIISHLNYQQQKWLFLWKDTFIFISSHCVVLFPILHCSLKVNDEDIWDLVILIFWHFTFTKIESLKFLETMRKIISFLVYFHVWLFDFLFYFGLILQFRVEFWVVKLILAHSDTSEDILVVFFQTILWAHELLEQHLPNNRSIFEVNSYSLGEKKKKTKPLKIEKTGYFCYVLTFPLMFVEDTYLNSRFLYQS